MSADDSLIFFIIINRRKLVLICHANCLMKDQILFLKENTKKKKKKITNLLSAEFFQSVKGLTKRVSIVVPFTASEKSVFGKNIFLTFP